MPIPTLAVWKLTSCDGCQLTLLDCEDELLTLAGVVHISHFTEASSAEEAEALVLRLADEYGSDVSWVSEEVDEETDSAEVVEIRAVEMEEEREVGEAHKEHERVLEQWFEEIMRKKVGLGEAEIVGADPITGKTNYRILRGKGWTR